MMLNLRSLAFVILLLPRLASADGITIVCGSSFEPLDPAALENFVTSMRTLHDEQVDELAARGTSDESAELREQHYQWALHADTFCREVGRNSEERGAELECLSVLLETEYTSFEKRLMSVDAP